MPVNGAGVFERLTGTRAIPSTDILSAPWNDVIDDIVAGINGRTDIAAVNAAIAADTTDLNRLFLSGRGFSNRAALQATTVPAPVQMVRLRGHTVDGRGGGDYYRVATPGTVKPWHVQSADGAYWQLTCEIETTFQQHGAAGDRIADDAPALRTCFEYADTFKVGIRGRGTFALGSLVVVPYHGIDLRGLGRSNNNATVRNGKCTFVKAFNAGTGPMIRFDGDDLECHNIHFDSVPGLTGHNVQSRGSRNKFRYCTVTNAELAGLWIGDLNNETMNANFCEVASISGSNCGIGLLLHHTRTAEANYPQGRPDVNAFTIWGTDFNSCTGPGVKFGNCASGFAFGLGAQSCTGYGVVFDAYARHITAATGTYLEANRDLPAATPGSALADVFIHANASQIRIDASRFAQLAPIVVNNGDDSCEVMGHNDNNTPNLFLNEPFMDGRDYYQRRTPLTPTVKHVQVVTADRQGGWRTTKDATGTSLIFNNYEEGAAQRDILKIDGAGNVFKMAFNGRLYLGPDTTFPSILACSGSPEGVITANRGTLATRIDSTGQLYRKTTDGVNTGWVAV